MRRRIGGYQRSIRRAATVLAVALFGFVAGCSLVSIGYNNASLLAVWGSNRWFALTSAQESDLRTRLEPLLAWHRTVQLPDYALFLTRLQVRIQGRVEVADVAWLYAEARQRFHVVVDAVAPDAAALVLTLRPDQIDRLESRFARTDQEFATSEVDVPSAESRERFVGDSIKSVERWLGKLDELQRKRLRALAMDMPFEPRLMHEDYVRRHRELIELLRSGIAGGQESRTAVESGLRRIIGRWQEGQSAASADYNQRQTAAFHRYFAEAINLAQPEQRRHATERLQEYIDELLSLAGRPSTRQATARESM